MYVTRRSEQKCSDVMVRGDGGGGGGGGSVGTARTTVTWRESERRRARETEAYRVELGSGAFDVDTLRDSFTPIN